MPEPARPAILSEPAVAAIRALNADPAAATYLAIAVSAVRARDEEVRAALRRLATCPALAEAPGVTDAEAMREAFEAVGRLLFGAGWEAG